MSITGKNSNMMSFAQRRKWFQAYSCVSTLIDLYNQYASGLLNNSEGIPAEFVTCRVACSLGRDKCEMVMVTTDVVIGEVVSLLGPFIGFITPETTAKDETEKESFQVFLQQIHMSLHVQCEEVQQFLLYL